MFRGPHTPDERACGEERRRGVRDPVAGAPLGAPGHLPGSLPRERDGGGVGGRDERPSGRGRGRLNVGVGVRRKWVSRHEETTPNLPDDPT